MIHKVIVLGSGSAGLIAAITLKRKLPQLNVHIVRDPDIGVIGVGEGSTPNFVGHLFGMMGIAPRRFYEKAKPTFKRGIRFRWGPRGTFYYAFGEQLDQEFNELKVPNGFFCMDQFSNGSMPAALMEAGKAFPRLPNRAPQITSAYSFHIENENLVRTLEEEARLAGIEFTDGKMTRAEQGEQGIAAIHLEDGQRIEADFFVDASGFRDELISGVLDERFVSFDKTLFCNRAVVGGWERTNEPILPYTTAEQMDCGWCWQIEHEHFINRGYVYCSDMISDDEAFAAFKKKNPKVPGEPRFVPFTSGFRKRSWVKNVVAIGNSAGFVEPLEATALMVICNQCKTIGVMLQQSTLEHSATMRSMYNDLREKEWLLIRDFLGLHYKFNTSLDTPFWQRCREETDLSNIQHLLDFYEENGPSRLIRHLVPDFVNDFGVEGFLVMLVGNKVPTRKQYKPGKWERDKWHERCQMLGKQANDGVSVKEALTYIRHPNWKWPGEK